jgi:hypothetical protein
MMRLSGVGEVLLRLRGGLAEGALVQRPLPRGAVRIARPALIIGGAPTGRVGFALARFQPRLGRSDRLKTLLAPLDLAGDVQLRLVLLRLIGGSRLLQQRLDLRGQLRFGPLHALVAHRLVPRGVGLDLGAVHRDRAKLRQPALARQAHHLHKQPGELLQVQRAEIADRAVLGEVARREHSEGHVLVQLARDLARAEHPAGIGVHQHLDHHGRVKGLVARPAAGVARVKGAQVQRIDGVADEVGQVPFGQPVLQRRGQRHPAPAGAAGRWRARWAPDGVSPHGLKPCSVPQSP